MKVNVGTVDRSIRIIVGTVLIVLTLLGIIGPWGWIGVLPLLTGFMKVCPAYSLLRINTCPLQKK